MQRIIECVPNFSEGNNLNTIGQITEAIRSVENIKVLHVDPGKATNRTVITFAGPPDEVCEAAFRAVKKAAELIDMRNHKGKHPRFGATDVLPLIPVSGITMEETIEYAYKLGERIGNELGIPVYCYECTATSEIRKNLANCRAGEYEGLCRKLTDPIWKPDFGPAEFNANVARTGATALSARNFLVAYNVNLNTTSTRLANSIAFDIREKGRIKREGDPLTGKPVTDEAGNPVYEPGMLKGVKGIGWYIEEYGIAQLSFNITDITVTSIHQVFEAACEHAAVRGIRVTGSELIGLVPLQPMLEAGRYFLHKQKRSAGVSDDELLKIAVKSMGLDDLAPFDPKKRIIEYLLEDENQKKLIDLSVRKLTEETASESPAPGGGSIAACMGAMGAALGTMVANLSAHKRGSDSRWEEFASWAEKGKNYHDQLLQLIDQDTNAFNAIMAAYQLPKESEAEKKQRNEAIQAATRRAIEVPLRIMQISFQSMELIKEMAENGNPNSVSDAGVGALAARSAVLGAALNVKINSGNLKNKEFVLAVLEEVNDLEQKTVRLEKEILEITKKKIGF
jgi:glutamate formiminotransferase/formiminotetrahydrofolate cyclodeaminase